MKKAQLYSLLLVLAVSLPLHAIPVKVGVYSQPPLAYLDKDTKTPQGLCIDLLNAMAAKNGWTLYYVMDSRVGLMNKAWRKEIDIMAPAPSPMDRADILDFATPGIFTSHGRIFSREAIPIPSIFELRGKTLAVLSGDIHYTRFQESLKASGVSCQIVEMTSYDDVLEAVYSKHADAGLVDHFFGEANREKYHLEPSPLVSSPVDFYLAVPHERNRLLLRTLEQEISAYQTNKSSLYYDSASRWVTGQSPYTTLIVAGVIALGLLLIAACITLIVRQVRFQFQRQSERLVAANRQLLKSADDHLGREIEANNLRTWYQTLLNNTPDPILVHGVDSSGRAGKFVEVNDTACLRLGYSREELLALAPRDIEITPGADTPRYAKLLSQWRNSRLPDATRQEKSDVGTLTTEVTLRTKGGREVPVEITCRILEHENKPVIFYSIHDITSRRLTQLALKESERRFSDFFARSPIGVALYNTKRELTDVNQSALGMFGMSERSVFASLQLLSSHDLSPEAQATLMKGGTIRYEAIIDFDIGRKEQRYTSTRTGKCHFDMLVTNLGLDANFNPKGFMLQMQDVTERRRAEESLHQHERMLRQAQKMEAIGTLAGGIAHDFNNILTPIIGYTEMALLNATATDPIRGNLEEVLKASHRAKDLVKQILTFSRQTEHEVKPIRLIPLIKEVMQLLRGSVLSTIELRTSLQTDRDMVKADPIQIHQVIMNLSANALHAMRETGGILDVGLNAVVVDSRTRGPLARLRYGSYVEITVRDTGHGMDRAVLDRIFEPFFTTKHNGEGTGMGLAVVHGIVSTLQGTITVESEVGKGTTFHVLLPLMEQAPEQAAKVAHPLPRGTEHILLVDDEGGILTMINQMLTSLGYRVMTSLRPSDALTIFREDPSRFDLIITDQIMPGMTSKEMVHEIHQIRPGIPVIICTGFSKSISDEDLRTEGVREVLMKPIVLRQLAEAIRRALSPAKDAP